jgi:pilus assembly protein CpaC
MTIKNTLLTGIAATLAIAAALPASAAPKLVRTSADTTQLISMGKTIKIDLPAPISDVIIGDPNIADVQVRSSQQIWIYGKNPGDTTISATDASGKVVFQKTIRVAPNVDSIEEIFKLAMPDAEVRITPIASGYLLTGTVASADDIATAHELAKFYVNKVAASGGGGEGEVKVLNMLRTGTPYQVNLQVRFAEVSRSLAKEISSNLTTRNTTDGFSWGIGRGKQTNISAPNSNLPQVDACAAFSLAEKCGLFLPFNPATGQFVTSDNRFSFPPSGTNILNTAASLFGFDIAAAFDLSERAGLSTTLAQPNLTTMSGETAEFLAGGQFPIPTSAGLGATSVEFRNFGISLQYTPLVLSDGRIRLRVRPEVSDISSTGAIRLNGFEIPGIVTRMTETTVELGSGQSFMIAGLLNNSQSSSVDKYPGLGDVPILGQLFKSNGWRKNETELVIVITPYLVKPVSESEIKLPTDGYNAPTDLERILLNKTATNVKGIEGRPMPTVAPEAPKGPDFGAVNEAPVPISKKQATKGGDASKPGFSFE